MATDSLIGTKIKRARERKRWTQRQLADALDVNTKTVDNWEAGRTSPRNRLGALEEVLGISLDAEPGPAPESWRDWTDDWERQIVEDRYMPDEDKRFFIEQSREARRAAVAARRERRAAEEQAAARSDPGRTAV